jgi:hypothetical protein
MVCPLSPVAFAILLTKPTNEFHHHPTSLDDYRRFAEESVQRCLAMPANHTRGRAVQIILARAWEKLADQAEEAGVGANPGIRSQVEPRADDLGDHTLTHRPLQRFHGSDRPGSLGRTVLARGPPFAGAVFISRQLPGGVRHTLPRSTEKIRTSSGIILRMEAHDVVQHWGYGSIEVGWP